MKTIDPEIFLAIPPYNAAYLATSRYPYLPGTIKRYRSTRSFDGVDNRVRDVLFRHDSVLFLGVDKNSANCNRKRK